MKSAALAEADALAAQIASNAWATGAPYEPAPFARHAPMQISPIFAIYVWPLEQLLEEVKGNSAGLIYEASTRWQDATAFTADVYSALTATSDLVRRQSAGLASEQLASVLAYISQVSHSTSNWTKVISQALQLCMRILETVQLVTHEALALLARYANSLGEVLLTWPWEFEKRARIVHDFAQSAEQFVRVCGEAVGNTIQAIRELVRLLFDLYRALIPIHTEIEAAIGEVVAGIGGGETPEVEPGRPKGIFNDIYNTPVFPFPGSALELKSRDRGYEHDYELGETNLSTEGLNELFRSEFGRLFLPSRVGDNTQLSIDSLAEGQVISTSLFGTSIPEVTAGEIVVKQLEPDGFVVETLEGHPEHPGEVAFRLTVEDGKARLQVTASYDDTILGKHDFGWQGETNPAFATISNVSVWSDMQHRIRDRLRYGD